MQYDDDGNEIPPGPAYTVERLPLSETELRDMMLYGPCWTCGTAMTAVTTRNDEGRIVRFDGACPTCDGVERQLTEPVA